LLDDPRWSACHLWQRGRELTEHTSRVPATVAALGLPPIPRIGGFAPMVMFSLLRPGTHIAPHHGTTNTRLICHLPLLTAEDCAIRVGGEVRPFEVGKTLIFDDSFEHEAWNGGSAIRVVLLFEIWRPDIGEAERAELGTLFELVEMGEAGDEHA
jgi:aspartyl/asparaginyl beta-hydroxylase (cupin superfamily)